MLRVHTIPPSLYELLDAFRPCFTAPTFATFVLLAAGLVARPAGRTVCGMLAGAGLGGAWHHSRAHRFFAAARWSADEVGLTVLRLAVGWLVPARAPVVIAVDDTLFRRRGRQVHALHWAYDGSRRVPPGTPQISRGNTFVVAAVVVMLPFLQRPAALPVAARLWRKGGPAKTALARELISLVSGAPACRGRAVHVVADGAYACSALRSLPLGVTLTAPLPKHASLYEVHPEYDNPLLCRGRRGRPRTRGPRIGTPAQLAAALPGTDATVTRYRKTARVTIREHRCQWPGVYRSVPVRVIIATEPGSQPWPWSPPTRTPRPPRSSLATPAAGAIEVAFSDAKSITGAGEARNRVPRAVERTVPFALFTQSLVIIWYHLSGHHPRSCAAAARLTAVTTR